MPVEEILRAYLDETIDEDVEETIKEEKVEVPIEEHKHEDIDQLSNEIDSSDSNNHVGGSDNIEENKEISFGSDDVIHEEVNEVIDQDPISNNITQEALSEIENLPTQDISDYNIVDKVESNNNQGILKISDDVDKNSLNVESLNKPFHSDPPILNDIEILV